MNISGGGGAPREIPAPIEKTMAFSTGEENNLNLPRTGGRLCTLRDPAVVVLEL